MEKRHKRLTFVLIGLLSLSVITVWILTALEENIVFFHSPTDIWEKQLPEGQHLRLGGLVKEGSLKRSKVSTKIKFEITDTVNSVLVKYEGLLPDLFREGQGVVVEGYLLDNVFKAEKVLAKHDENYMPPEVADALKASGQWEEIKNVMKHRKHTNRLNDQQ